MGTTVWSSLSVLFFLHQTWGRIASGCVEAGVTVPPNAHVLTVVPGKFVLLECDKGYHYRSRSEGVLWCENNTWVSQQDSGQCRKIDCGYPPSIENGRYEAPLTVYNSSALYICDSGYSLYGDSTLVCDHDGHWNGTRPYCNLQEPPKLLSTVNSVIQRSTGTTDIYKESITNFAADNKSQVAATTMQGYTYSQSVANPNSTTIFSITSVYPQKSATDVNGGGATPQGPISSVTDASTVSRSLGATKTTVQGTVDQLGTITTSTIQGTVDQWGKYISKNTNRNWTERMINMTKVTPKLRGMFTDHSTEVSPREENPLPFTEVVNVALWLTSTQNTRVNTTVNVTGILGTANFVPGHILSDMGQLEVVAGICIGLLIVSLVFIAIVFVLRKRKRDEGGSHVSKKPTLYNRMSDESTSSSRDRICTTDYVTDLESGNSLERYKSITVPDLNNIDEFMENELYQYICDDQYDGARITVPSIKNINLLPTILEECSANTSETSLTESFHDLHRNNHDPAHSYIHHGVMINLAADDKSMSCVLPSSKISGTTM